MYTPAEACDYATRTAGNVKRGWNQRFIDALYDVGYRLQPIEYRDPRPLGSIDAPLPFERTEEIQIGVSTMCPGGWHYPSIIVPVTIFDRWNFESNNL